MTLNHQRLQQLTRRHFLKNCQLGIGGMALGQLMARDGLAAAAAPTNPLLSKLPHFAPTAKRVIYIHLTGSPPHLDLWNYRPELVKRAGEDCPDEYYKGKRFAFTSGRPKLLGTPRTFKQFGDGGLWMSDAIPHFHGLADDLCVINSMNTDQFNHAPAELFVYTGSPRPGRPSMGARLPYGLGSANGDMPSFVVMIS